MKRFVKPHVMKGYKASATKLAAVEVSSLKGESLHDYSKIDIGFEAETAVKQAIQEKKVKDKDVLEFRLECRKWLTTTVCKLLHKTAVQYTLARNLAFLDPRTITESETNPSRLKSVLRQLVQFNRVAATDVDDMLHNYQDYADSMINDHQEHFTSFNPSVSRLDTLLFDTISRNESYSKL